MKQKYIHIILTSVLFLSFETILAQETYLIEMAVDVSQLRTQEDVYKEGVVILSITKSPTGQTESATGDSLKNFEINVYRKKWRKPSPTVIWKPVMEGYEVSQIINVKKNGHRRLLKKEYLKGSGGSFTKNTRNNWLRRIGRRQKYNIKFMANEMEFTIDPKVRVVHRPR